VGELLAAIQADLQANGATGATVALNSDGEITITAGNDVDNVNVTDQTIGSTSNGFGLADGDTAPTVSDSAALAARVDTISANDVDDFFAQSISGGAITVYAGNGAPANVQMRWAKVNSNENGGAERWNLFVLTNANATGTGTAWTRMGGDYQFGNDGSPNPTVEYTDLPNLTVNGVTVGNVRLQHGQNGLTQFADPNGVAEVTTLNQNGYAAGEYVSVAVNDNGRVVVSYNNGQQLEVAQVVTANFNAVNQLKRMDGGVFAATSESGEPILDNGGGIIGSSLEASNTDISEEFTKLIVTQQAYAAGTRIVSTADQMLQDALNMIR
jgi:flagellar hook protein FlgE